MSGPGSNEQYVVVDTRRRRSAEEKRAIVAELLAPGASVSAIARKHNIASSLLFRWRKQFGSEAKPGPAKQSFVPVVVTPPAEAHPAIEIELANRRRLRVDPSIDPILLKRVVEALEGR